ncbi:DsbA family protein [Caulobacter sp. RL271]|jgi:protein-disulfide isomerase|uniref:DsbA family protein n=1 Tax=Caulobacter segnis TaxID=88688 RepID=A0ABY4ZLJ8_9CAUL|nr:DsbA family protein [Caulobacter segnis]USQ93677.1 DsbA family protein [Caulobacter segnis]
MLFRRFVAMTLSLVALAVCGAAGAADYGFKDLLRDPGTPRAGAVDADVVIVMYADYNCGYCKRMEPVLAEALDADPRLAVVHKDWPIFGDVSEHAARVALAATYQGRYEAVHRAFLLSPTRLSDKDMVEAVAKRAGVDWPRLTRDLKAHAKDIDAILARNEREAALLSLQGTPGLVINGYVVGGALSGEQLKALLQKIRAAGARPPAA